MIGKPWEDLRRSHLPSSEYKMLFYWLLLKFFPNRIWNFFLRKIWEAGIYMSCQGGGKFRLFLSVATISRINASAGRQSLYVFLPSPSPLCLSNSVDCSRYWRPGKSPKKTCGKVHFWNSERALKVRMLAWSELMFFPWVWGGDGGYLPNPKLDMKKSLPLRSATVTACVTWDHVGCKPEHSSASTPARCPHASSCGRAVHSSLRRLKWDLTMWTTSCTAPFSVHELLARGQLPKGDSSCLPWLCFLSSSLELKEKKLRYIPI